MHFEDLLATAYIRQTDHDLTVETSRTGQCGIQDIGTVGCGNHDYPFVSFKAVHFHQHLVQRLFTFIMTTPKPRTALTTDRIDLVNKNQTRRIFLRLLKHIAHTGSPHTDEHFYKIGTRNGKKRHFRFTGNGFGN